MIQFVVLTTLRWDNFQSFQAVTSFIFQ
jgi:hypothetical protein